MIQVEQAKLTYAEIVERLRDHPDLAARRRGELISAVRSFVRRFEHEGMGALAVPERINAILDKATPAMARLAERSFCNMISRLRGALKLCSIIVQPKRHTEGLKEPWASLFEPITDHQPRSRLSRFFHTASRHGWNPEEITAEHFSQLHRELTEGAIIKDGARLVREAAKYWNDLAAQTGWPRVDFKLPRQRQAYTFTWDHYPPSLGAEIEAMLKRLGDPNFLSDDHRPALKPRTLVAREFHLRQFAAALVHSGYDPAQLKSLRDLCTVAAFKDGLRFFYDRAGGKVPQQLIGIAQTIYSTAKYEAGVDPTDLAQITKFLNKLRVDWKAKRGPGLTQKNQRKLAQFDSPRYRDGILLLPRKLHQTAKSGLASGHLSKERAAGLMMTAVVVEILLMCPIRISNLASLSLDRHVRRQGSGNFATTHIYIPPEETKNGVEIHCELPTASAHLLEEYIHDYRPDVPGSKGSPIFFPGRNGKPRSYKTFWLMISRAGRRYVGVDINPHLFRHIAAKLYLDEHPGGYEVVRRTLGHTSMDTTARSYAGQETGRSIRHYDRTILKLRDEAAGKPQSARLRRVKK